MSTSDKNFGNWAGFAQAAAKLYLEAHGIRGASATVDLITSFVGLTQAQTALLESIQANTELLRTAKLKTAQDYLDEARRLGPSNPRYRSMLEDSVRQLYTARNLAANTAERSVVEFHLSVVYLLESEIEDAKHWIERAAGSAEEALNFLTASCQKGPAQVAFQVRDLRPNPKKPGSISINAWRVVRSTIVVAGTACAPFFGTLGAMGVLAFISNPQDKRVATLESYISFYNTLQLWRTKIYGRSAPSPLALVVISDKEKEALKINIMNTVALLGTEPQIAAMLERNAPIQAGDVADIRRKFPDLEFEFKHTDKDRETPFSSSDFFRRQIDDARRRTDP